MSGLMMIKIRKNNIIRKFNLPLLTKPEKLVKGEKTNNDRQNNHFELIVPFYIQNLQVIRNQPINKKVLCTKWIGAALNRRMGQCHDIIICSIYTNYVYVFIRRLRSDPNSRPERVSRPVCVVHYLLFLVRHSSRQSPPPKKLMCTNKILDHRS